MFKKIVCITLLLSWMVMIFLFSAQTAPVSDMTSDRVEEVVIRIVKAVYPPLRDADKTAFNGIITLTVLVRKSAHFFLYFILGSLAFLVYDAFGYDKKARKILFLFTAFYAISDEVHQLFVPGRAGLVGDVVLDALGAVIGIFFMCAVLKRWRYQKSKKTVDK